MKNSLVLTISMFLFLMLSGYALAGDYQLPDTGIDKCYDNDSEITCPSLLTQWYYGQDAQYDGPQPTYTDNGNGTVTDLNTGLMWQQGDSQNASSRTWQEAGDYCSGYSLAGHSDWRLPNRRELMSIVDYGRYNPAIDTAYFPNCGSSGYWSDSTYAGDSNQAWAVDFYFGYVLNKASNNYVRCVRGEPIAISNFHDNGDGTVSDSVTGLMWQQGDGQNDTGHSWRDALFYCECLSLAGYRDWRLPNVRELETIVDCDRYGPAIDTDYFPNCSSSYYRSSSTLANGPAYTWDVNFGKGFVANAPWKLYDVYFRCVRGGPDWTFDNLDHFVFSTISSPQTVGTPFSVTVTAVDANGNRVWGFFVSASLTSNLGAVSPTSTNLVSGQATVSVKVYAPGNTRFNCSGYGAYGYSNYFNVTGGSACSGKIFGRVIDARDDVVYHADVKLLDSQGQIVAQTQTDTEGEYAFAGLDCDTYDILVGKSGETETQKVSDISIQNSMSQRLKDIQFWINLRTRGTPVILVPGMMGSSSGLSPCPDLPEEDPAKNLRIHLYRATGFKKLEDKLTDAGYNVFKCPWDWRHTCKEAWMWYLYQKIDEAIEKSTTGKVHVVAHSMGGLVVRAYIQSKAHYKGDIDKLAMVGTPHLGSCNPYYIWEGGDPKTVDDITDRGGFSSVNPYTNTIQDLWENTYHKKHWSDKGNKNKEIRAFVRDKVPSLLELMYTGEFLTKGSTNLSHWAVGTPNNVNTWLKELNLDSGSSEYNSPGTVMSKDGAGGKVKVELFVGDKEGYTIRWIISPKVRGIDLYEDGVPRNEKPKESNVWWNTGDGTVPYESAVWPFSNGWASLCDTKSKKSHMFLVGDFADEIVAFLTGTTVAQVVSRTLAAEEPSVPEFSVSVTGDARVLVTDGANKRTGIDHGTNIPLEEIPGSGCRFGARGGGVRIENPAQGLYTVTYFGDAARDLHLEVGYMDDTITEIKRYRAFRPASPRTFTVSVNPSGTPRIVVTPPAKAPTNLQANPYTAGQTELTRLSWSATGEAGVTGYNIYTVEELDPYFSALGTVPVGTTSLDTAHTWSGDSSNPFHAYAVTAVKSDGTESFFSELAENNDRDHDGLTDSDETSLGTNKNNPDTDGDGLNDGDEQAYSTNPLVKDTDGDTFSDYEEIQAGTDPLDPNSVPETTAYVSPSGDCNGKTPCYSTIQEAIDAARNGAVILIAQGTYTESFLMLSST